MNKAYRDEQEANKFANDHDNQINNKTDNKPFGEILKHYMDRRVVLKGGVATAVAGFLPTLTSDARHRRGGSLIGFDPVSLADASGNPGPVVSSDYKYEVLIPWGDPLEPGGPVYSYPPTAADQAKQIGIGHDGMEFYGSQHRFGRDCNRKGVLAINHEFGGTSHVLGKPAPTSLDDVRTMQHAHGVSVVGIEQKGHSGKWKVVSSTSARRIHANTPMNFSGPAATSDLLKTPNGNIALGTLNNCGNGTTPWGTYLTCEENFNGYFGATANDWEPTEEQERYGFSSNGFGYGWHNFDRRFDLSDEDYRNEENRFGWIVEIDPNDASKVPVKRTALGRFKHEGAGMTVGRGGRAVVYMGDDQRFDYIYKFVSDRNYRSMLRDGVSPLDEGKLYVARFDSDGTGEWLELTLDDPVLAANFNDQAEVLVYARVAADLLGATPMDRPEWTTVAPNGDVYCTLTNNSQRTVADAANPLAPNADGHIIRWRDSHHHVGTSFEWEIFLIAEDTHGTEESFADPDGLLADPDGRLFIQTDGGQKDGLENQLLVADTNTKEVKRLFTGVPGCEITGITMTPNRRTMFINVQHPGNGNPSVTSFPAADDGVTVPRDCTIVLTRKNGGIIGS